MDIVLYYCHQRTEHPLAENKRDGVSERSKATMSSKTLKRWIVIATIAATIIFYTILCAAMFQAIQF